MKVFRRSWAESITVKKGERSEQVIAHSELEFVFCFKSRNWGPWLGKQLGIQQELIL